MCWISVMACFWSLLWTTFASGQRPAEGQSDHLLYIPIPSEISKEEVREAGEALKNRLHSLVKERLRLPKILLQEAPTIDFIVIFTDHDALPILPNLAEAKAGANNLTVTTRNELTFTFNSPANPWTAEELTALDTALGDFYQTAKTIYGNPAFNITVNVRKDPTASFAGLYYPSLNEMVLKNASATDVICHEMIHAFRDDDVIGLSSYEEGMTRAAEVEVHNRLANYTHWDENHSYPYDVYYEGLNTQTIGAENGNLFLGYISVLLRYQQSGYAWAKAFLENSNFFADFNSELYARTLSDPTTTCSESKLLAIATTVQFTVEGKAFLTWYGQQGVFNTNPPKGYFLYQRINQFTVDYFYRNSSGSETMQPAAIIQWAVYDYQNMLLDSGRGVTSAGGWINLNPTLPPNYTGRIKVRVTTSSPNGTISNTTLRTASTNAFPGGAAGVFGTVPEFDSGTITITPLDDSAPPVTLNVAQGAFFAPALATVKGRFLVDFHNSSGHTFSRQFSKDASDYYLLMTSLAPFVSLNTTSLDFGSVLVNSASAPQTVAVSNSGSADLVINRAILEKGELFQITADNCSGQIIVHGGSCSVSVVFSPLFPGQKSDTLQIKSNADDTPHLIALRGTGIDPAPALTVLRPNGGEKLFTGTAYLIEWTASDSNDPLSKLIFDVFFSTDGGTTFNQVPGCQGLIGVLSCTWAAPGPAASTARIRVTAQDAHNTSFDNSNANFSIISGTASIALTQPNTAVNWGIGSTQQIQWNHNLGTNSFVLIEVSRNGGINWELIQKFLKNAGSNSSAFNWVVTGPDTNQARFRVSWTNGPTSDTSDVNFTIAPAFIKVSTPGRALVNWGYETKRRQTWTTNLGPGDRIRVQLSTDGGRSFPFVLAGSVAASNKSVTFNTPTLRSATAAARIQIQWLANRALQGTSPANFKVEPAFVRVTNPNLSTDIWPIGTSKTITWENNLGLLELANIKLSTDGGATYSIMLFDGTASDGSQSVTVQSTWATQRARIGITWTRNTTVNDTSDQNFSIQ